MFESAELGHRVDKADYTQQVPALREALLTAQMDLAVHGGFPVIVIVGGIDGAGRGETVNLLNEWMDARFIATHAMGKPTTAELERPPMWRFWQALPPKGRIGLFLGSWYTQPILNTVGGDSGQAELEQSLEQIRRFEKMLTDEGVLLVKFWLHLSRREQKKRLEHLEAHAATRWRVSARDWRHHKHYAAFRAVHERVVRQTSTAEAPWIVVEGYDARFRELTVGKVLLEAMRKRLDEQPLPPTELHAPLPMPAIDNLNILRTLDLTQHLADSEYSKLLDKYQGRLAELVRQRRFRRLSVIAVFEGNDAAGKGGAIRRVVRALDARHYRIIPIAAPSEDERAQPYLWRFWRHIPGKGRLTVFDRSWYGRVLVERVEGFCSKLDWMRAYGEINDFEAQLTAHRVVLVKFWLAIGKDEQLKRFQAREAVGYKHFKITAEDWRNREKWEQYEQAVCDMVDRTSCANAPWTLVTANDKHFARIQILRTLCERIETALQDMDTH